MIIDCAHAITAAMTVEMRENPDVFLIGEDVALPGGAFGASQGMLEEFGPERIVNTPICEQAITGLALGAAITGMRPIAEIMHNDFICVTLDQIVNQAAKFRYMYGGKMKVPIVFRMAFGGGTSTAAQHSQCLEGFLAHVPGLKVAIPSSPQDAYGLIRAAVKDDNPVAIFEHQLLYDEKGELDESLGAIPLGQAAVKREGKDLTVVATAMCVKKSLEVAEEMKNEGIDIEVIDPRTLYPLDKDTIYNSVKKTGKVVIVTEEVKRGAWSAELASNIGEELFDELKAPIIRIGALNVPIPYSIPLEQYALPQKEDIIKAVNQIAN
ncbi:MAG: alpha-ketoacid dehydrogenase subunit beta [Clostridia bacterium]|nr:alpha-ketoacid dehydrogenase subunit beta [Clostridia bacterium]